MTGYGGVFNTLPNRWFAGHTNLSSRRNSEALNQVLTRTPQIVSYRPTADYLRVRPSDGLELNKSHTYSMRSSDRGGYD